MLDPEYLRLYREYSKAIKAFDIAHEKRTQVRARFDKKRAASPVKRHPIGPRPNFDSSSAPDAIAGYNSKPESREINMGKVLGWAKIINSSPKIPEGGDPTANFDSDALYDQTQLKLYLNAKRHYLNKKKAFFDYVRRGGRNKGVRPPVKDFRKNLTWAMTHAEAAVNNQLLGIDNEVEEGLRLAKMEVETAFYKAWENYQNSPNPKSTGEKKTLVKVLIEGQLVGLDETPIFKKVTEEVTGFIN